MSFGGKLNILTLMVNLKRQKMHRQHCSLTKTHMYVVTAQNSFYSCILDWDQDIQKVIISYAKKPAALLFLSPQRSSKHYSFFIILNLILQWKWTFFLLNPFI